LAFEGLFKDLQRPFSKPLKDLFKRPFKEASPKSLSKRLFPALLKTFKDL
jgi:hypothetical protein